MLSTEGLIIALVFVIVVWTFFEYLILSRAVDRLTGEGSVNEEIDNDMMNRRLALIYEEIYGSLECLCNKENLRSWLFFILIMTLNVVFIKIEMQLFQTIVEQSALS